MTKEEEKDWGDEGGLGWRRSGGAWRVGGLGAGPSTRRALLVLPQLRPPFDPPKSIGGEAGKNITIFICLILQRHAYTLCIFYLCIYLS